MTTTLKTTDSILFVEKKNGSSKENVFENTAGGYIDAVFNDNQPSDFPENFHDLPVVEQLELCISRNSDQFASSTIWTRGGLA